MKYSINTLFITSTLLFCCSPEKEDNHSGRLISKVEVEKDYIDIIDTNFIHNSTIIEKPQSLINNSNVLEKLTEYGLENQETKVNVTTKFGSIKIRLYKDTPLHRANFIMLTKKNYFDSTLFYRVINNFVVQGGNSDRDNVAAKMARIGQYRVPDEIHSHHIHKRGVIAMAVHEQHDIPENEKDKRSSPYNFYIVQQKPLSENYMDKLEKRYKFTIPAKNRKTYNKYGGVPHLDGDFTVFGEVYSGMSVIDKIATQSTDAYDRPREDLFITVEVIE
jgi:cyclophilin family peptidyl-prolyl cis-trans isomerase